MSDKDSWQQPARYWRNRPGFPKYGWLMLGTLLGLIAVASLIYLQRVPLSRASTDIRSHVTPFFGSSLPQQPDESQNICPIDIVVVFDVSDSMDFETPCFGCWQKDPAKDIIAFPYPGNGDFNPQPNTTASALCTANPTPLAPGDGLFYLVHEAELYSGIVPLQGWEFNKHVPGQGFWALQRQDGGASGQAYLRAHPYVTYSQSQIGRSPRLQGAAYDIECFSGPNLSGQCWQIRATTLMQAAPSNVPWVEYDFTPAWSGPTYIWIRAQAGSIWSKQWHGANPGHNPQVERKLIDYQKAIFWQIDGQTVQGGVFNNLPADGGETLPDNAKWRWLKLGPATTTQNVQSTLKLYQGSSGFMVDKIIFTNEPGGMVGTAVDNLGNGAPSASLQTLFSANGGQGPPATDGSATREACNLCNPEFGLTVEPALCSCQKNPGDTSSGYPAGGAGMGCTLVLTTTNQLNNDLFFDQAPLRNAQEGVKKLAHRLDPHFHQLGFVAFGANVLNNPGQRAKLQCLRWAENFGDPDGAAKCYDPTISPISFTTVISGIENQDNNGSTNIAGGMREGLEELGVTIPGFNQDVDSACTGIANDHHACDRGPNARKFLILITDGAPSGSSNTCPDTFEWRGVDGRAIPAYNCAMWYALQAANNNVIVYTIGIAPAANADLLTAMATGVDPGTGDVYFDSLGGQYYLAAQPSDLDPIYDAILPQVTDCQVSSHLPLILK